jgi:ribosomal protein L40E
MPDTHLANKLTEQQLKQFMGWVQGSDMASVYVHLSMRNLDQAILELHGISIEKERKERFERKICPRCDTENSLTAKFCLKCGFVLEKETEQKLKEWEVVKNEILNDPEFIKFLKKKLKQRR